MRSLEKILENQCIWNHQVRFPSHTAMIKLPDCGTSSLTAHYYRSPVDWENYRVPGQMNIEDFLDMGGGDNGDKKDMP